MLKYKLFCISYNYSLNVYKIFFEGIVVWIGTLWNKNRNVNHITVQEEQAVSQRKPVSWSSNNYYADETFTSLWIFTIIPKQNGQIKLNVMCKY